MIGKFRSSGINIKVYNFKSFKSIFNNIKGIITITRQYEPDVIQGWMYHGNLMAILIKLIATNNPLISWNIRHSLYKLRYEKFIMRVIILFNSILSFIPDLILYNSWQSKKQHESIGFNNPSSHVIPNGIKDSFNLDIIKSNLRIRRERNISNSDIVIGHVARFHPMKDHATFIKAAIRICIEFQNTSFLFCGRNVSLSNAKIKSLIPKKFLNRFIFEGESDIVPEIMSSFDIFCVSSAWGEGFSNVLGEAMAIGIPCVVSDVGDSALIVDDSGIVVKPRSVDSFYEGLKTFILTGKKNRHYLGVKASEIIKSRYTIPIMVINYLHIYKYYLGKNS